jgi:hypothetical protein
MGFAFLNEREDKRSKPNSALISMENFQEFYGYMYASHAQFFSGM